MEKYPRGRRGGFAKALGGVTAARGFDSLLLRHIMYEFGQKAWKQRVSGFFISVFYDYKFGTDFPEILFEGGDEPSRNHYLPNKDHFIQLLFKQ